MKLVKGASVHLRHSQVSTNSNNSRGRTAQHSFQWQHLGLPRTDVHDRNTPFLELGEFEDLDQSHCLSRAQFGLLLAHLTDSHTTVVADQDAGQIPHTPVDGVHRRTASGHWQKLRDGIVPVFLTVRPQRELAKAC